MVTASVSRRVWVTLTRVSAAPTRSFTRYRAPSESPVNRRWSVSPARVADRKDPILFFGGTAPTFLESARSFYSYSRKLHFVRQLSYPPVSSSVLLPVFDGTRFVRFSISRQKSAKENFYVEKVCFQNLNQRWTILFKISIENCYERY